MWDSTAFRSSSLCEPVRWKGAESEATEQGAWGSHTLRLVTTRTHLGAVTLAPEQTNAAQRATWWRRVLSCHQRPAGLAKTTP